MNEDRIDRIAAQIVANRLTLGPRKKNTGNNSVSFYQKVQFDPDGWELPDLMKKIIRNLKKPPVKSLPGHHKPRWFVSLKTSGGQWPVDRWTRREIKTFEKLKEMGQLLGIGSAGWVFVKESRSR
jgi:hypothetical protein